MANGKLEFISVHLQNFRSYQDVFFPFQQGNHLIRGNNLDDAGAVDNGAGKTTIANAIYWAITGTLMGILELAEDVVNLSAGKDCCVTLTMSTPEGNTVIIKRHQKHSANGNKIFIDLDGQDITAHRIADNQKKITEIIDIDVRILKSVILMDHKLGGKFSSLDGKGRVALLESIRDFSLWDTSRQNTNSNIDILNKSIKALDDANNVDKASVTANTESITSKVNRIEELNKKNPAADLEELQKNLEGAEAHRIEISESLDSTKAKIQPLEELIEEASNAISDLEQKKSEEIAAKNSTRSVLQEKLGEARTEFQLVVSQGKSIASLIEDAAGVCPTCHRPIENMTPEEVQKHKGELDILRADAEAKKAVVDRWQTKVNSVDVTKSEFSEEIEAKKSNRTLLQNKLKTRRAEVTTIEENLRQVDRDIGTKKTEISRISSMAGQIDEEKSYLSKEIRAHKLKIKQLEIDIGVRDEEKVSKQDTKVYYEFWYQQWGPKGSFRPSLLIKDISFINRRLSFYSKILFENFTIQLSTPSTDDREIRIETRTTSGLQKKVSMLSGGEEKRVDLAVQFSIYDLIAVIAKFRTNLLFADEIFDALDVTGVEKAVQLIEEIDTECKYVISHNQYLKSQILSHIVVTKKGDVSTIVIE